MRFESRCIELRDGRTAELRRAEPSDAEELVCYRIQRATETEFMLRDPDECGTPSETVEEIQRANRSETELVLVCVIGGRIVGCAELSRRKHRKTYHRAEVSVGTLKACWGQGIGSTLMREVIRVAEEYGISQLELNVFEGNDRAISMYERLGFHTVAVRPNCIHWKDGTRLAAITMFKSL